MKLEGDYLFEASVPEVWSALFDPVILAAVMPGCEKLDLVDGQYVGEIKVKVGPIQGAFTGKVDLKDKIEPQSYTMIVDGRGAPGFVKATAKVALAAEGESTRVHYDADAQIGGKIASVGQRLLDASARAIVAQSLEGLHTNIKLRAAAYREAAAKQVAPVPAPAAAPAPCADPAPATPPAAPTAAAAEHVPPVLTVSPAELAAAAAEYAEGGERTEPSIEPPHHDPSVFSEATVKTASPNYIPMGGEEAAYEAVKRKSAELAAASSASAASAPAAAAVLAKPAAAREAPPVSFTPVKVKQSDLANAVAKEVASSLFPRSVLVAIILLEAIVIVFLLLRH
jgi:carbon monoxide dehydrogenase subunit G